MLYRHFREYEAEAERCLAARLPLPAYDHVLKCSHAFNMLDARGVISVTDRTAHIARVRDLARKVAGLYLEVVGDGTQKPANAADEATPHDHAAGRDRLRGAAPPRSASSVVRQLEGTRRGGRV